MTSLDFTIEEIANEEWRAIKRFPNYAVSNLGRIKRIVATKGCRVGHILKPAVQPNGYHALYLCAGSRKDRARRSIHRLVCAAFLGEPNGRHVNHKDARKTNNRIVNLEYCTPKENIHHAMALGLIPKGETHGEAKLTLDNVREIRRQLAQGVFLKTIAAQFGVSFGLIGHIKCGRAWKDSF